MHLRAILDTISNGNLLQQWKNFCLQDWVVADECVWWLCYAARWLSIASITEIIWFILWLINALYDVVSVRSYHTLKHTPFTYGSWQSLWCDMHRHRNQLTIRQAMRGGWYSVDVLRIDSISCTTHFFVSSASSAWRRIAVKIARNNILAVVESFYNQEHISYIHKGLWLCW